MISRATRRRTRGAFLAAGTAAMLFAAVPAPAMADEVLIWNGFGAGRTAARAIDRAIDDAENSAGWQGPVTCELVEEPLVWTQFYEGFPDPFYFASVNMICE